MAVTLICLSELTAASLDWDAAAEVSLMIVGGVSSVAKEAVCSSCASADVTNLRAIMPTSDVISFKANVISFKAFRFHQENDLDRGSIADCVRGAPLLPRGARQILPSNAAHVEPPDLRLLENLCSSQ